MRNPNYIANTASDEKKKCIKCLRNYKCVFMYIALISLIPLYEQLVAFWEVQTQNKGPEKCHRSIAFELIAPTTEVNNEHNIQV